MEYWQVNSVGPLCSDLFSISYTCMVHTNIMSIRLHSFYAVTRIFYEFLLLVYRYHPPELYQWPSLSSTLPSSSKGTTVIPSHIYNTFILLSLVLPCSMFYTCIHTTNANCMWNNTNSRFISPLSTGSDISKKIGLCSRSWTENMGCTMHVNPECWTPTVLPIFQ